MSGHEHAATLRPCSARTLCRALVLAFAGLALAATGARASPTQVDLRVEGGAQTLFEGPIASEGHAIEASSDTQPRVCDGIDPSDPENTAPGATPTAAAVDAMSLIGETFDGRWYESYDDYLITRWGPLHEAEGHSWFVIVNHVLTSVGGCQVELHEGSEVVWAYAPASPAPKAMLELFPQGDPASVPPVTADATVGVPFIMEAESVAVASGRPPALPQRIGFTPAAGAKVAPVSTSANGSETIEAESPQAVLTDAEGKASITFTTLGWHRLKATHSGAVAANRLDVCVSATGTDECGPLPPEDAVRSVGPKAPIGEHEPEHAPTNPEPHASREEGLAITPPTTGSPAPRGGLPAAAPAPPTLRVAGYSLAALDVRARTLHFRGRWRRVKESAAWHGIAAVGSAGATLSTSLSAGVPAFAVLYSRHARVQVIVGKQRHTFALSTTHSPSLLRGPRRTRGGALKLRVISGTVALEGVGLLF